MHSAADLIEAQQKQIAELERDWEKVAALATEYEAKAIELEAQLPKEGEWVGRQKHRRCSICGFSTWYDFALGCELTSPFCPNCGANMKGEQE